jgi:RNA polymerase sigma factor (TIGR02999 family)
MTMSEVTQLLHAVAHDQDRASDDLLPLVYDELRRLAGIHMARELAGHTLQPTALVHEAWLRLTAGGGQIWQNRAHFFAAAAEAMRRILIENARRKSRLKHGGHLVRTDIDGMDLAETTPDDKVLKFFGGLTNREVAETMGVGERSVDRQWAYAKAWLFRVIRSQA